MALNFHLCDGKTLTSDLNGVALGHGGEAELLKMFYLDRKEDKGSYFSLFDPLFMHSEFGLMMTSFKVMCAIEEVL